MAVGLWHNTNSPIHIHFPALFVSTSGVLLALGIVGNLLSRWRRPALPKQVLIVTLAEIGTVTVLMHAAGGVASGLGMLLIVPIAGAGLLMEGRAAMLTAAVASLSVLADQLYTQIEQVLATNYPHAGLLGAAFFSTALLTHALTARARESEQLAAQRGVDLANLAELNEYVLQRLQSGVLVVDAQNRIRLINRSAAQLLGVPVAEPGKSIEAAAPELALQLDSWRSGAVRDSKVCRPSGSSVSILPRFAPLGPAGAQGTLIFLDDSTQLAQHVQQLKLASLGRLTASIAHEIRNPLGAISHAAQLLAESPHSDKGDVRLIEIIRTHAGRMNTIIENILQLSRRKSFNPEPVLLKPWLERVANEFIQSQQADPADIHIEATPDNAEAYFDPSQLQQVLWNLAQNGLRACRNYLQQPKVELQGGINRESGAPYVEVVDYGPGIDPDTAAQIFEPFFTTERDGTGLGLYIARELCEVNGARLDYLPAPTGGSCFRITFADVVG